MFRFVKCVVSILFIVFILKCLCSFFMDFSMKKDIGVNKSLASFLLFLGLASMFISIQAFTSLNLEINLADVDLLICFIGLRLILRLICSLRLLQKYLSKSGNTELKVSVWFWLVLDILWLFIFIYIYWWGGGVYHILKTINFSRWK